MSKKGKGELSHYVDRIMKQKHLSRRDVKLRSGGEITDSYVSGIISGTANNPSVEKLKALARGLRVSERELVDVAFGLSDERQAPPNVDLSHTLILVDITKKAIISTDVAEIVQGVMKLSPSDRAVVRRFVIRLGKSDGQAQRKWRSV